MLKFLTPGFFWAGILFSTICYGQSPLGIMPMDYNSSFAGESGNPVFNSNIRYRSSYHQAMRFNGSFDHFIPSLYSGIGVVAAQEYDLENSENIFNQVRVALAPKISIKGKVTLSPSIDYGYIKQQLNEKEVRRHDSRLGLMVNNSKFYIGYSLTPFSSEDPRYRARYSLLQAGYTFQRTLDSKFSLTPQILIGFERPSREYSSRRIGVELVKFMLGFRYDKFLWGISDDGLHAGWQSARLRLMLFNNLGVDYRDYGRGNATHLAFRYTLNKKE